MGLMWLVAALAADFVEVDPPGMVMSGEVGGGVSLADVNDDGWLDLVYHDALGTHVSYHDGGDPASFGSLVIPFDDATFYSTNSWRQVILVDLDHDGDLDLGRTSTRGWELLENDGGTFVQAAVEGRGYTYDGTYNMEGAALVDLDGDGDLDVVAESSSGNMILTNGGTIASFVGSSLGGYGLPAAVSGSRDYMTGGDVDGNGFVDLLFRTSNAPDALWLNLGASFVVDSVSVDSDNATKAGSPLCDLDDDGDLDIVHLGRVIPHDNVDTGDTGAPIALDRIYGYVYENDGGSWIEHELDDLPSGADALGHASDAVCGDVDHDGDLDIYMPWSDGSPKRIIINNLGGMVFDTDLLPGSTGNADGDTAGAAMGDIDRDGDLDVVLGESGDGNILYNETAEATMDTALYVHVKAHVGDPCGDTYRTDWYVRASLDGSRSCPAGGPDCGVRELSPSEGRGRTATPWLHFAHDPGRDGLVLDAQLQSSGQSVRVPVPDLSGYPLWVLHDDDLDGDGIPVDAEGYGDTDGDGWSDDLDLDADGDGIDDAVEVPNFVRCSALPDADGDYLPDHLDDDADNDGLGDGYEGTGDSDGDGAADYVDADDDGDGIPTADELDNGSVLNTDGDGFDDHLDDDSDNDGLSDGFEGLGDPDGDELPNLRDPDSDNDSVGDGVELPGDTDGDGDDDRVDPDDDGDGIPTFLEGTDDLDGDGDGNHVDEDADGDGALDIDEGQGDDDGDGDPNWLDPDDEDGPLGDPDNDAFSNEAEAAAGTDPGDSDTDDDGALDGVEVLVHGTDPLDPDTDGGGALDGAEVVGGTNPLDPYDDDETGVDTDGDGLPDAMEETLGTDPTSADTDGDGLSDREEIGDTDGDGVIDALEPDDDGDGVPTEDELGRDTDGDGLPDHRDADDDGDGIPTAEDPAPLDPASPTDPDLDSDRDGLSDADEALLGTDPLDPDSDGDGVPDGVEGGVDSDGDGVVDALDDDDDGDGLPTLEEGDGDPDGDDVPAYLDDDSDGDGLSDAEEGLGDADGDGLPDALDASDGGLVEPPVASGACQTAGPSGGLVGLLGLLGPLLVLRRSRR